MTYESLYRQLLCWANQHSFVVIQNLGGGARRIGCPHCRRTWGLHDQLKVVLDWDADFEDLYTNVLRIPLVTPWARSGSSTQARVTHP